MDSTNQYIAFDGDRRVGTGGLVEIARAAKRCVDMGMPGPLLLFDAVSSEPLELDLRGSLEDVLARLPAVPDAATATAHGPSEALPDVARAGRYCPAGRIRKYRPAPAARIRSILARSEK